MGLQTWYFGAPILVTWHSVSFGGQKTYQQDECILKNFLPRESYWTGHGSLIIDDILSRGSNVSTESHHGSLRAIGSKYKVSSVKVSNILKTFCQMRETLPKNNFILENYNFKLICQFALHVSVSINIFSTDLKECKIMLMGTSENAGNIWDFKTDIQYCNWFVYLI